MGRSPVVVRPLAATEIDALAPLWAEFLDQEQAPVPGGVDIAERVRERILASDESVHAGRRPTYRVVVAEVDGAAVGFASLSVVDRGLLSSTGAVVVDVVHVSGSYRKHGVGTALLREAAGFADEVGGRRRRGQRAAVAPRREPLLRALRLRAHGGTPVRADRRAAAPARGGAPARPARHHRST